MSVVAVAALGDEPLGGLPARREQRRRVGALQLADELAVLDAAQLGDRRQVDARIGVDEEPPIRRELDVVRAVPLGEDDEAGAVEIHAGNMDVIRVLPGADAHRRGTRPGASPRPRGRPRGRPIPPS